MIPKKLVHSRDTRNLRLQRTPIRLQYLHRHIRNNLLHDSQHSRSENRHSATPLVQLRMPVNVCSPYVGFLVDPHLGETLLDVLEVHEEPEDELVTEDRLSGED